MTLDYGNYGIFLIMVNAGFISSTLELGLGIFCGIQMNPTCFDSFCDFASHEADDPELFRRGLGAIYQAFFCLLVLLRMML